MADKKFTIGIDTTADTSGVEKAERSIDQIGDEARRTERELDALETQSRKAGAELARTGNTSEGVASKLGGPLTGKIQQAGFQIQDFAVQVGGGTSAMTAFGQQAPQFLGVFGPAGSIAGAIISIGAVAFNVFSKMGDDAQSASEKLEEMDDVINQIAKNKTDELNQEFADTAAAFDLAQRRAVALKTGIEEVVKSENKLALAQLDRRALERESATAEANRKALAEGRPVDTRRVANDAALRAEERAAELARQGVAAEQGKVAAAQTEAQIKAANLKQAEAERLKAQELLAADRERLDVLRKQQESLDKFIERGGGFVNRPQDIPEFRDISPEEFQKRQGPLSITGKAQAQNGAILGINTTPERKVLEGRIALLEAKLTGDDAELNKAVADLSVEALAAQTNVANQVRAARNNVAAINLDLGTASQGTQANRNAATEAGVQNSKQGVVGQLEGLVAGIGESGGRDLAPFITEMKAILQDKALSADELARLPTLMSQYFARIANLGSAQNQAVRDAMSRVDELEREVRNLKTAASSRNP